MDFDSINQQIENFIDSRVNEFKGCDPSALMDIFENPIYAEKLEEFMEECGPDIDDDIFAKRINQHFKEIGFETEVNVGKIFDEALCIQLVMQPFFVNALKEFVGYQK
ncbi:hypothetical protein HOU35_gp120 [Acinetobacter phage vB_AbaM_B09_Aci05]|uniref:Uncharacterized protein n=1 Tax=Acinetobacter phage vB_AbaM_B09_Aci05 TaxID=2315458 RepID=A0A386KAJ9_9CAUD|nr:hypothetical protein HOU35_gp120 [Acinetobacter phage vB_AbaM_B09_Aci05]AYD82408.1 hypothetical protein Aci05_057 [Acinetobacter phage vB_AbaM_B09_Aci05]